MSSLSEKRGGVEIGGQTLKPSKNHALPGLGNDLEVSIDIDWPAERIEEEYRKQQT